MIKGIRGIKGIKGIGGINGITGIKGKARKFIFPQLLRKRGGASGGLKTENRVWGKFSSPEGGVAPAGASDSSLGETFFPRRGGTG